MSNNEVVTEEEENGANDTALPVTKEAETKSDNVGADISFTGTGTLPPAADLQEIVSGTSLWPWIAGGIALSALFFWFAVKLFARKSNRVPDGKEDLDAPSERTSNADAMESALPLADSPTPSRSANPPAKALSVTVVRLETTFVNLVLNYRATIMAPADIPFGPGTLFARLTVAHRATSLMELTSPLLDNEWAVSQTPILPAGQHFEFSGTLILPLAQCDPILSGSTAAIVPVVQVQFIADAAGLPISQQEVLLLGLATPKDPHRLAPIRLDKGPRNQRPLGTKLLTH